MIRSLLAALGALAATTLTPAVTAAELWDNGPQVTTPGGGFAGADVSELQIRLGGLSYGYGLNLFAGQSVADDFHLDDPAIIDRIVGYAYQPNAPTSGTITGFYLRIWSGPPGERDSTVLWGDPGTFLGTNFLITSEWSGVYRASTTGPLQTSRAIMTLVADIEDFQLAPGTYWLEWAASGSLAIPSVLIAPVTYPGKPGSGNARRFNPATFTWIPVVDGGAGWPDDLPFRIEGEFLATPEDLSRDGHVDGLDLAMLLGDWGDCDDPASVDCPADLNFDGLVNGFDLAMLLAAWDPS